MERSTDGNSTEKDIRMMHRNSFESSGYAEKIEDNELKKKKKKKKSSGSDALVNVEKKDESEKDADAKTSDQEARTDKKTDLASLFEKKDDEDSIQPEEEAEGAEGLSAIEAEPELPKNDEEVSGGELQLITQQLLDAHEAELQTELEDIEGEDTEEAEQKELVLLAQAAFIDDVRRRTQTEVPGDAVINDAVKAVGAELDIAPENDLADFDIVAEAEKITKEAAKQAAPEQDAETEEAKGPEEEIEPALAEPVEAFTGSHDQEAAPSDEEVAADDAATPAPPQQPPSTSGGHRPPQPPGGGVVVPPGLEAESPDDEEPAVISPQRDTGGSPRESYTGPKYRRGADLLVGGIIGYLIGRRRGRIKTEKRLIPIQKSLEKQVKDQNEKLLIAQEKVAKLTAEKVAREGEDVRNAIAEKVEAKARAKQEARDKIAEQKLADKDEARREAQEQAVPVRAQEEEVTREIASEVPVLPQENDPIQPEAPLRGVPEVLPQQQRRPEKLASVVLAAAPELAESRPVEVIQPSVEAARPVVSKETAKQVVQKMPEAELLVAAAKIEVGGQTAKQLYEQGRVSKEDLKEVVVEHVRGNGRAERLLVERLRPAAGSETMEYLPREGRQGQAHDDASGGGAASLPPVQPGSSIGPTHPGISHNDVNPGVGQLDNAPKQAKSKAPVVWATGAVIAASALAFLVL